MHFYAMKSSLLCRQEWKSTNAYAVEITQISPLYQQALGLTENRYCTPLTSVTLVNTCIWL